jgi:hypothetical protein
LRLFAQCDTDTQRLGSESRGAVTLSTVVDEFKRLVEVQAAALDQAQPLVAAEFRKYKTLTLETAPYVYLAIWIFIDFGFMSLFFFSLCCKAS